jgi:hypothetical protein
MATAKKEVLTAIEFNGETGETIERELTAEEIADLKKSAEEAEAIEAERDAKIAARQSALAKLADLGLTAEEIAAL